MNPPAVRRVEIPKPNGGSKKSWNTDSGRPNHRTGDGTGDKSDSGKAVQ